VCTSGSRASACWSTLYNITSIKARAHNLVIPPRDQKALTDTDRHSPTRCTPPQLPGAAVEEQGQEPAKRQRPLTSFGYIGCSWHNTTFSWGVQLTDPQTKRNQSKGYFASEEDAARAYDFAAVQAHGPGAKRNFAGEDIGDLPCDSVFGSLCPTRVGNSSEHVSSGWG
jgi:hypothetical protein